MCSKFVFENLIQNQIYKYEYNIWVGTYVLCVYYTHGDYVILVCKIIN